ncbi:MAG: GNAT family N-acetyltransferase [Prevotella sp.]|nr:GNAT family N-acetyltransferase [Prevotella sp.]
MLWKAHERNRAAGMNMLYPSLPGDELEKVVGAEGRCFVAIKDGKLVGTCSYKPVRRNMWYDKGQVSAYFILEAVSPEYEGKGIYARLCKLREEDAIKRGFRLFEMDTAERNYHSQTILKNNGFRHVFFRPYKTGGIYAVHMAKWVGKSPFPKWYCKGMFLLRKVYAKVRFKPGYIKRFGI